MALALLFACQAFTQDDPSYSRNMFDKLADSTSVSFSESRPYYIIQSEEGIPFTASIIRQIDKRTAIIRVNDRAQFEWLRSMARISPAYDQWKYSPHAERVFETDARVPVNLVLSSPNLDSLISFLRTINGILITRIDRPSGSVVIRVSAVTSIPQLLSAKEVTFMDVTVAPVAEISIIGYNRSFHGINAVDYLIPAANGKNIVVGVKEQKMNETDIDLYKRVLSSPLASANASDHATIISSVIGGAGNSFYDGRGIAHGCKFFSSSFDNLFADDASILNANKVTVQNHSYGTIVQQFYGAEAVSYDAQCWANKSLVHVFSAGNRGTSSAPEGKYANISGYANLTGNFKMAKNIITVGAIDNKNNIPAESSSGPAYDGRLSPQLIALGPNGTSDAAAVVAGSIAVMHQVYADSNNQAIPPASLIKAILFNTADDVYNPGIDYKTGYGSINSYEAINSLQQKEYDGNTLTQGQQWIKSISLPPNAAHLKVTLAWTDSASTANNLKALINDLDLGLFHPSSNTVYRPWVLSTVAHIDSLSAPPVRKRDSLNTTEQVSISLPTGGEWQIRVYGTAVINPSIQFHVAWHIDTLNTFRFTNPQHTSDVNRDEKPELDIRWRTFVADTNQTGNLYISYNAGVNWQPIRMGHKIYQDYYRWPIRDTSSRALFKMETSFGDFLSREFVITRLTRPVVEFLCADSFRISWQKHIYANSYNLYALTDSPYLENLFATTDTFVVLNRTAYPFLVYAIQPSLNNDLPASRSLALDITAQAVKCFYKTIYYNLFDLNRLQLILELSAPGYVDSVFFEQVTAAGQLLQGLAGIPVNTSNNLYDQTVDGLPAGTVYWRARIKLKTGAVVYTETISVTTSGQKFILFYPNPIDRNGLLAYILQQNLPANSKLQLFDVSGRLIRSYQEIPASINLSTFAPGLIIYRLTSVDGQVLENGKLLIR